MFFSGAIPAAIFFIMLFFVPETPRYLVMKGRNDKALAVLRKIGGEEGAEAVLANIKSTLHEVNAPWLSYGYQSDPDWRCTFCISTICRDQCSAILCR
jgi:SP family xylose:H+ symportor-like MFS transporter